MYGIDRATRSFDEAGALLKKRTPTMDDIAEAARHAKEGLAVLRHGRALLKLGVNEVAPPSESGPLFEGQE